MKTVIWDTHEEMSRQTARRVADAMEANPAALYCFAAGHTQRETLQYLAEEVRARKIPTEGLRFISLDEWVGHGKGEEGSCYSFITENLFTPLSIGPGQYFFFDGKARDMQAECGKADAYLDKHGPLCFTVLGIGLNGHLGFNEPGVDPLLRSMLIDLDETSKNISPKYFGRQVSVSRGITLGLSDLFRSTNLIVQCTGANKEAVAAKLHALPNPTNVFPASLLRELGEGCSLFLDKDSAGTLKA